MQYQCSNCPYVPVFGPPAGSIHSAVIYPPLVCERRYRYRSYTSGSPLLDHPTGACIGPGANDTDHPWGGTAVRSRMEALARRPQRVRPAISRNPPDEGPHAPFPISLLLSSGRCTPALPDSRTESVSWPQERQRSEELYRG